MIEKLCVFCEHSYFDDSGSYEDYVDPTTFACRVGHFDKMVGGAPAVREIEDFRRVIVRAEDCPDYQQVRP